MKYDLQKKLWIYLHKNRTIDYAPWNEHLKKTETKNDVEIQLEDKVAETSSLSKL